MKWFQGAFNSKYEMNEKRIKELYKENFNISVSLGSSNCITKDFNYFELYNSVYQCNYDNNIREDVIIAGDIEIYNIIQLQEKYFKEDISKSEKELMVNLYKLKGIKFVEEIIGEFSFVLYDKEKMEIYMVIDHLGSKPLFWIKNDTSVYFATDMFLLKDYFDIKKLDRQYFSEYYNFYGQVTSEITPYSEVKRIEAATYMCFSVTSGQVNKCRYWDLSYSQRIIEYKSEKEYIDNFLLLLKKSIANKLLQDGKDGLFMSGGLDSTSVYAIIKSYLDKTDIVPICGVFDELKDCDEKYYIEQVLSKYNDTAKYVVSDEYGMLAGYPHDYFYTYEPNINMLNQKFISNFIRCANKNNITNIIDGYAADHLLTGSLVNVMDKLKNKEFKEAFSYIKEGAIQENESIFTMILKYVIDPILNSSQFPQINRNLFTKIKDRVQSIDGYNRKQLYIQMSNANGIRYADRELMPRYNVSSKHPFLDRELIEYIFNIPGDFRKNKKYPKYILRESIKDSLPEEVVTRVSKTQHVSLTFKGISSNWDRLFPILRVFRIGSLKIIDISKEEWEKELCRFRTGQTVADDFYILVSIELWLYMYYEFANCDNNYKSC